LINLNDQSYMEALHGAEVMQQATGLLVAL